MSLGADSRYCDHICRDFAQSRSQWISYADRRRIYEEDSWTCQICGELTSKVFDSNNLWSPTLDHVIPRSKGGSDDRSNLRTAHLWCNSLRGDGGEYSDAEIREVRGIRFGDVTVDKELLLMPYDERT